MKSLNNFISFFLLLLIPAVVVLSCRHKEDICMDPYNADCPNYDPCLSVGEADALFHLEIQLPKHTFYIDTTFWYEVEDTLFMTSGSTIYFRANSSKMDAYAWKVGYDPRTFTDSLFNLWIDDVNAGSDLAVQLAVANDTLGNCLQQEQQRDTTAKAIFLKACSLSPGAPNPYPMNGKFEGYVDGDSSQSYTIKIELLTASIIDFPGISLGTVPAFIAPKEMWIFPKGSPRGYAALQDDYKTIIMDYQMQQDDGSWESHQFVGVRVE